MHDTTLSHFACFRFTPAFWALAPEGRAKNLRALLADLATTADAVHLYQCYPARGGVDFLVWSAIAVDDTAVPSAFFARAGRAVARNRTWLDPGDTLWGLTRPSPYVREPSRTTIEPFTDERRPYLAVYPFVKTHAWHRLPLEERRRLMGEHIAIGRKHEGVRQLLLYAHGVQDQDFVVVYETADLDRYSELVAELRATEVRAYTARDTPIWTAMSRHAEEAVEIWAAGR
jgi:chlorite dismutase